jgi:triacylglycerol esterase/lipase EstA (alpha/beta hydrolase family)
MWVPSLRHAGYRVCEVTLPLEATGDIQVSAEYVARAIQRVGTPTTPVVVLTHSQGALEARWALKYFATTAGRVAEVIELGAPNHGISTVPDVCQPGRTCQPAAIQMIVGSTFLRALNRPTETPGGAAYVSFYSLTDKIIRPVAPPTAALVGARNVAFQSICPARAVTHAAMLYDPWVFAVVSAVIGHPAVPLGSFAKGCTTPLPRSPFTHPTSAKGQARPRPRAAARPVRASRVSRCQRASG